MKRLIAYISRLLDPRWYSHKLDALSSAKSKDFLENYYEVLQEPIKEEDDAR